MNASTMARPRLAGALLIAAAVLLAGSAVNALPADPAYGARAPEMGMPDDPGHAEMAPAPRKLRVKLQVRDDAMAGWNIHVKTKRFTWAPEHVNGERVRGEGHAHLYVDGEKVTRLYGPWYYLGALPAGEHTVSVTLNANDHATYARDGEPVGDSAVVVAP